MGIQEKIDAIRSKPERIRLRWAWGLTFFFTFCVIVLWTFSLKLNNTQKEEVISTEKESFLNEFQTQKKSLKDATSDLKGIVDQTKQAPETEGFEK